MTKQSEPVRVLIVDDSPFVQKALLRIFDEDVDVEVAGLAGNGREALELVDRLAPDVLTLDVEMPVMDGLETLEVLMNRRPLPVLMLSQFTHEGAELTLRSLELGAMDFVDKSTRGMMDFYSLRNSILTKVKAIAGRKPRPLAPAPSAPQAPPAKRKGQLDLVAIGTSTGGPPALNAILRELPADIPFGMLIVQHMPAGFTRALAERLDSICAIKVREARNRDRVEPGLALIAPSGLHMSARKGPVGITLRLNENPADLLHRPSINILFQSVADTMGPRGAGVILTGMGSDGADALGEIRKNGGHTIAQDEATSIVFGMPRAAIQKGHAVEVLPLEQIAKSLLKHA